MLLRTETRLSIGWWSGEAVRHYIDKWDAIIKVITYMLIAVVTEKPPETQTSPRLVILTMSLILSETVSHPNDINTLIYYNNINNNEELPSVQLPAGVIVIPAHVIQEIALNDKYKYSVESILLKDYL